MWVVKSVEESTYVFVTGRYEGPHACSSTLPVTVKSRSCEYISILPPCSLSVLLRLLGSFPLAMMCTPVPEGEASVYESSSAMISCAHCATSPDSGSRHLSRSMPTNGSPLENTNPTPNPCSSARRSASSKVPHVKESVVLAYRPVRGSRGILLPGS